MNNLTPSANSGSRGLIWRALLPLLVLFTGLGSIQTAFAQSSTVNLRNVIVTSGTTSANATTSTYDAVSNTAGPGVFAGTNFGSLDVNLGRLLLQGGSIQVVEKDGEVYDQAFVDFGVAQGTLTSASPTFSQSILLVQTGYDAATSTRTFSISNASRNILTLASTTGVSYRFDIGVRASGKDANDDQITINAQRRRSIFTPTGTPSTATINVNNIQIAADGVASPTSYYFPNTGTSPQFPGFNFTSSQNAQTTPASTGAFDINNGQLRLLNTVVTTNETGSNSITSLVLYYRTRTTTSGGAFQPITLTQSGPVTNGTRTFVIDPTSTNNTNSQPNLVATPAVTAPGNYVVEVYYQANVYNSSTTATTTIDYPPNGSSNPFAATFTVGGTPIATTIWTGGVNDNWFDAGNWTAGIPTASTNALIRDLGAGNSVPYPNIRSDVRYTTPAGALIYDNTGSGPAKTLNFIMGGTSQASRSIARLVNGQLQVFGNFDNTYDSYIQRENTIIEFAGVNQTITGGSFVRVDISGGGNKTLVGVMNVSESLNFLTPNVYTSSASPLTNNPYTTLATNAGILSTDITAPTTSVVVLADRATANFNNGAQLNGENDPSFVFGFISTTRQGVLVGEARTYGNIGMDLTFNGTNNPGKVEVTRNTVEAYSPFKSNAAYADNYGIRRIFGVRPADAATNSGGLTATMVFHYRDAETINLDGPDTRTPGTGSIPEQNLTIFVSSNSGNTFALIGRNGSVNTTDNTVTRTGVTTFATFTLGDTERPLPIVLSAFNAVRSGSSALITWATASETNNKGFNVQVSADGAVYRNLGFVTSKAANSSQALGYSYSDTEEGKAGTRYYRLEQVDLDGKTSYSPVRAVNFDGAAASAITLVAYPNPFNSNDLVGLSLQGGAPTEGIVYVKLIDMTGRTVRDQRLSLNGANLPLGDVSDLRSGLYVAKVTLPDGTTQTVRVQKQ